MSVLDFQKSRAERLADEGYRCIREGDDSRALEIAAQLEELASSTAFEIAALAHHERDDLEAAVRVLERGVEQAPDAWLNWQLLGNFRSDLERYQAADEAYAQALACADVDPSSIHLNQAILASRCGQHDRALVHLEQLADQEWHYRKASAQITALVGLGRVAEAITVGEAALDTVAEGPVDDERSEEIGYLAGALARARVTRGDPAEQIFTFAAAALEAYDWSNRQLLAAIRDADHRYSSNAKYFRMTLDAKIPFTEPLYRKAKGYMVSYDVVADSLSEALAFVERMEEPMVRGNLIVEAHEVLEHQSSEPKGVYKRTLRHYYESEE